MGIFDRAQDLQAQHHETLDVHTDEPTPPPADPEVDPAAEPTTTGPADEVDPEGRI